MIANIVKENTDKNPAMYTKLIVVLITLFMLFILLLVKRFTYILSICSRICFVKISCCIYNKKKKVKHLDKMIGNGGPWR